MEGHSHYAPVSVKPYLWRMMAIMHLSMRSHTYGGSWPLCTCQYEASLTQDHSHNTLARPPSPPQSINFFKSYPDQLIVHLLAVWPHSLMYSSCMPPPSCDLAVCHHPSDILLLNSPLKYCCMDLLHSYMLLLYFFQPPPPSPISYLTCKDTISAHSNPDVLHDIYM